MAYVPDQGDIVWLDFNPSSGKEIMKRRPAFVISRKAFNNHTGLAIVAPITSTFGRYVQRPKDRRCCACVSIEISGF